MEAESERLLCTEAQAACRKAHASRQEEKVTNSCGRAEEDLAEESWQKRGRIMYTGHSLGPMLVQYTFRNHSRTSSYLQDMPHFTLQLLDLPP